ncbi:L-threonine 3-dehydrogenase, partial [bacterium]
MRAIAKTRPAPGVEIVEVDPPELVPGSVRLQLEAASVCGTDLHIWSWDAWSAGRIHPPRIIGHEFCGTIVEVAPDVTDRKVGDFVASESHIVCGHCRQCRAGQAHVCTNTRILGVDVDGGFRPQTVLPAANAVPTSRAIPAHIASFQDALGNAVHTATAGPVKDQTILVTGLGPIGLMAASVCRALGARKVYATEVAPYRRAMAEAMGVDVLFDPTTENVAAELARCEPGGVDAVLEMSGHPSQITLAIEAVRPGGRISCLGVYKEPIQPIDLDALIFKGIDLQ